VNERVSKVKKLGYANDRCAVSRSTRISVVKRMSTLQDIPNVRHDFSPPLSHSSRTESNSIEPEPVKSNASTILVLSQNQL